MFTPLRAAFITVLAASSLGLSSQAQEHADLRVLFVGDDEERAVVFTEFLGDHFENVERAKRTGFNPDMAGDFDVVMLDWSQREIDYQNGGMAALESPLGARDSWDTPTVLIGSAGLLIAAPWQTSGSYG